MTISHAITGHYHRDGLEQEILAAVEASGATLSVDVLAAVDEFHTGGRRATESLVAQLNLRAGQRVLDVGSGIGGTARFIATEYGAAVVGIDLTPEYVTTARALTSHVGLNDRVRFEEASAEDLPFSDGHFDAVSLIHIGMNVERKDRLFAEIARVLTPGGRLAIFDIMRVGAGEVDYPTPWATAPDTSFLADQQAYRDHLAAVGLDIVREHDWSSATLDFVRHAQNRAAHERPKLGPHLLMGDNAAEKGKNVTTAIRAGVIAPVEMIASRTG